MVLCCDEAAMGGGVYARLIVATVIIGASLSEPHTSGTGTALRRCVCIRPCLRPYTVNLKCAFKYFPKIERPRAHVQRRRLTWMHGTLLLVCHSSYGLTINGRLLADRTKLEHCGASVSEEVSGLAS